MVEELLIKIKQEAIQNKIPIILDDTLEVIDDLLKSKKPKNILEIGTATGYSAICFSKYLENNGYIDTIERDEERIEKAKENIKKMKLEDIIHIHEGDAIEILNSIEKKYDVVFIDAAKSKYPIFLEQALRLTKKESLIIADNILYKGYVLGDYNKHKQRTAVRNLREFIKKIQIEDRLETKILEVGDGLSISRRIKE